MKFEESYSKIIEEYKLNHTYRYPWILIGQNNLVQGWKIHLSSIQKEAELLLHKVIPFLKENDTSFKLAQSSTVLGLLNEGALGATQVGKFITIYPRDDEDAKKIAFKLVEITKGFHGPIIPTDLRLGNVVYTRYGAFNPIVRNDRLSNLNFYIYAPDGTLIQDSYKVPFDIPSGMPNPFKDLLDKTSNSNSETKNEKKFDKILGPGYMLFKVLKSDPKGSIFLGMDVRSQKDAALKIIKQGRPFCLSDRMGRDIRSRLKHQEALHHKLSRFVPIPKANDYFEVDECGYLPLEYIEGENLEKLIASKLAKKTWSELTTNEQIELFTYLKGLIEALKKLHTAGFIHRDLTGSNVLIGDNNQVYLIDLEMAYEISSNNPPYNLGTAGFMSPQQEARKPPTIMDDIYSLGCIMILLITGLDPRRILFANEKQRIEQLMELVNGVPYEFISLISKCIKADPIERPSLESIQEVVQKCLDSKFSLESEFKRNESIDQHYLKEVIRKAQYGLLNEVAIDQESGLWLSVQQSNSLNEASCEIRRDANKGVAGVLYLLGRLARFGYASKDVKDHINKMILPWLLNNGQVYENNLPGLHFGEAGVAVAIVEAISGDLINRTSDIDDYLAGALRGKLDWPDITHGAAGQGLAILYCIDRLQDEKYLHLVHRCADYLISTQKNDGSWVIPDGVNGMSGETITGFAHGVSGILYFLAEYSRRFDDNAVKNAIELGMNWLLSNSIPDEERESINWAYSDAKEVQWKWWCHGSPGIALTFLRLYEQTKNEKFADLARKALLVHPEQILNPNLSQCHGLSGLGEIYLEASRVLGDPQWDDRASHIAKTLLCLRRENNASVTWIVENPNIVTADLMVGSGSVVHFLLNFYLHREQQKASFPLLLDPIAD